MVNVSNVPKKDKNKSAENKNNKDNIEKTNKDKKKNNLQKDSSKNDDTKPPTHLYMHDKFLTNMVKVPISDQLTVLYLHNNDITKIENIGSAVNLTLLYLQKNKIKKIENLHKLTKLRKLYLGHNEINVVENLHYLHSLEELHLEKQRLQKGDSMCFDPRSIYGLSKCLKILNISYNNITSIEGLAPLQILQNLDASYNNMTDVESICKALENMYYLLEASFVGNPVAKIHRYRESIIGGTQKLACLDGKDIKEVTRCFIKRFEHEKNNKASKQSINITEHIKGLPKNYPLSLQKAVSASILKNSYNTMTKSFETAADTTTYIPWKGLQRVSVDTTNRIPPLMRQHKKRYERRPTVPSSSILKFSP